MGGLFAIGWTLDDILDLTWDQVMFCASAVMRHKSEFYGMIMESVGGALGVGIDGLKKGGKKGGKAAGMEQQILNAGLPFEKG